MKGIFLVVVGAPSHPYQLSILTLFSNCSTCYFALSHFLFCVISKILTTGSKWAGCLFQKEYWEAGVLGLQLCPFQWISIV